MTRTEHAMKLYDLALSVVRARARPRSISSKSSANTPMGFSKSDISLSRDRSTYGLSARCLRSSDGAVSHSSSATCRSGKPI